MCCSLHGANSLKRLSRKWQLIDQNIGQFYGTEEIKTIVIVSRKWAHGKSLILPVRLLQGIHTSSESKQEIDHSSPLPPSKKELSFVNVLLDYGDLYLF